MVNWHSQNHISPTDMFTEPKLNKTLILFVVFFNKFGDVRNQEFFLKNPHFGFSWNVKRSGGSRLIFLEAIVRWGLVLVTPFKSYTFPSQPLPLPPCPWAWYLPGLWRHWVNDHNLRSLPAQTFWIFVSGLNLKHRFWETCVCKPVHIRCNSHCISDSR